MALPLRLSRLLDLLPGMTNPFVCGTHAAFNGVFTEGDTPFSLKFDEDPTRLPGDRMGKISALLTGVMGSRVNGLALDLACYALNSKHTLKLSSGTLPGVYDWPGEEFVFGRRFGLWAIRDHEC